MPLLLVSCLTRVLWSNATEKNVKCELPPCPALEQRAGREHPAKGGGDRRGGDQGQGKAPKDGAVSGNACGCESHSIALDQCCASLFGQWREASPKSHLKQSN